VRCFAWRQPLQVGEVLAIRRLLRRQTATTKVLPPPRFECGRLQLWLRHWADSVARHGQAGHPDLRSLHPPIISSTNLPSSLHLLFLSIDHNHPTTSLPSTTPSAATAGSCIHSTHLSFSPKRSAKSHKMKGALLTAAVLLGSAQAATHKLKLKKVPLAEQLVCASIPERCHNRMLTFTNAGDDAYRCPGSASRPEVYGCSTSDAHGCCLQWHAG